MARQLPRSAIDSDRKARSVIDPSSFSAVEMIGQGTAGSGLAAAARVTEMFRFALFPEQSSGPLYTSAPARF